MSFVQYQFGLLMLAVLVTYWVVRDVRWQNLVIVLASAVFYGWAVPWWLLLLYTAVSVDFVMAQLMHRSPANKALWLGLSLTSNLGILFYFKYFNFFLANVEGALNLLGVGWTAPALQIILPAGLSFYTFQTISYTVDVYRGVMRPRTSLLNYLAYTSFFPQLVAGPIERATDLLPQIERHRPFQLANLHEGFSLVMWGLFKKIVLADSIAPYVDKVFVLDEPRGPLLYISTLAFGAQLYVDFSAYTDIARGSAQMLGIRLVQNFNEPYLAVNVIEFWQRWHISLSTWIRDYLLTPMLARLGTVDVWRMAAASTVTMFIMGLWHGASWNFVLTGLFQGLCIGATQVFQHSAPAAVRGFPGARVVAWVFNWFVVMAFSGLMFREHELSRIWRALTANPFVAPEMQWRAAITVGAMGLVFGMTPVVLEFTGRRWLLPAMEGKPWRLLAESVGWSAMAVLIVLFYRASVSDFVYFQF
jgi:alginate O-acetyltransferase complex protein AlgI